MRCEFWFRLRIPFAFCTFSHIFAFFALFRIFLTFCTLFTTFWFLNCDKWSKKCKKSAKNAMQMQSVNTVRKRCDAMGLAKSAYANAKNFLHYHPCVLIWWSMCAANGLISISKCYGPRLGCPCCSNSIELLQEIKSGSQLIVWSICDHWPAARNCVEQGSGLKRTGQQEVVGLGRCSSSKREVLDCQGIVLVHADNIDHDITLHWNHEQLSNFIVENGKIVNNRSIKVVNSNCARLIIFHRMAEVKWGGG